MNVFHRMAAVAITLSLLVSTPIAHAHFVFVLPDGEGTQARVILSEDLELDENVDLAALAA